MGALARRLLPALAHETLTTTVLFDREIVRILQKHCVMCHTGNGPAAPLETYEQAWIAGRADARGGDRPPHAALAGTSRLRDFANDNSLTLREMQFMISWVEGWVPATPEPCFESCRRRCGPSQGSARPRGHGPLGVGGAADETAGRRGDRDGAEGRARFTRGRIHAGRSPGRGRRVFHGEGDRAVDRRVDPLVQPLRFTKGLRVAPSGGGAYRRGHPLSEGKAARGCRYAGIVLRRSAVFEAGVGPRSGSHGFAEGSCDRQHLTADVDALALRVESQPGVQSIEVSARKPNGTTEVMLFDKNIRADWPTPYIFKDPVLLPRGSDLAVVGHYPGAGGIRLTVTSRPAHIGQ